tara:strand:+ start:492 stop:698 length:207 start_codon:yes stop_codon:yes gene_type:complete
MVLGFIDEVDEDGEYYSECCSAPPLYDVHSVNIGNNHYPMTGYMGICMKCRENAMFEIWGDEDPYENN